MSPTTGLSCQVFVFLYNWQSSERFFGVVNIIVLKYGDTKLLKVETKRSIDFLYPFFK